MKHYLLAAFFACLLAFTATPPTGAQITPALQYTTYTWTADTMTSGADTVLYFTYPREFKVKTDYNVLLIADSISGSTNGIAYIQYYNATVGATWANASGKTLTINGVQSATWIEGTIVNGKLRIKWVKSAGTQSDKVRAWLVLPK